MSTIEYAFDVVNDLHYIDEDGNILHGELLPMEEIRQLMEDGQEPLSAYILAHRAIYRYLQEREC